MPELRELRDHELLRKVLARIKTAESLDNVRRVWTRKSRIAAEPSARALPTEVRPPAQPRWTMCARRLSSPVSTSHRRLTRRWCY